MNSFLFQRITRAVLPVVFLFGFYLLVRGHNQPGGGFIAGLVTAAAFVLQALAFGAEDARSKLSRLLRPAFALGLLLAVAAGLVALFGGKPFLEHLHVYLPVTGGGNYHLSTTLLFDMGVFLVVVGTVITLISVFAEADA